MRVLFLEDVINVANAGEIKEVANGFARNYLLPKNLATVATPEQMKRVAKLQRVAEDRRIRETGDWQAIANKLEGTTLHIQGRVGPTGQFYGAISVTRIIQELVDVTGQNVERRTVELSDPIRQPGNYEITLRFHQNVAAQINVVAQAEGQEGEVIPELEEVQPTGSATEIAESVVATAEAQQSQAATEPEASESEEEPKDAPDPDAPQESEPEEEDR